MMMLIGEKLSILILGVLGTFLCNQGNLILMVRIGILIYPNVEVLDFCGPFEVFRNAKVLQDDISIDVFAISATPDPVDAQGLVVIPSYTLANCPDLDILVIPGGNGNWLAEQEEYREFVMRNVEQLQVVLTVCTGALLPAALGLFTEEYDVTTHQEGLEKLRFLAPQANVLPDVRFTHSHKIITSGGISAGIDSSLYTVKTMWGLDLANKIARYMEYDWQITEVNTPDPSLA